MEVKAKQVSSEFLNMSKEEDYPVHSCFEHGFNLAAEGRLCFIGNKHDELLPYGILLKKEDVKKIRDVVSQGETLFCMDQERQRLVSSGLVIDFSGAQVFSSRYQKDHRMRPQMSLDRIFGFIKDEKTGFGDTIGQIVSGKCGNIEVIRNCFRSRDKEVICHILKKWVGYGPGLTPSGDDFLLGILFADEMFSFLGDSFKAELVKLADSRYTTDVSVNQYFCALQHLFSKSFLEFANAWKERQVNQMAESLKRILLFGHTSGRDIAAGLWTGIQYAEDKWRQL